MPRFVGHEIRTKLAVIASDEGLRNQLTRARKFPHVVSGAFHIPLQLGESQVMGLQCEDPAVAPGAGAMRPRHPTLYVIDSFGERGRNRTYNLVIKSQGKPFFTVTSRCYRLLITQGYCVAKHFTVAHHYPLF